MTGGWRTDEVELMAAFDSDDAFVALVAMPSTGMQVRADGSWFGPGNRHFLSGANVVTVDAEFVTLFDLLDARGATPTREQALAFAVPQDD